MHVAAIWGDQAFVVTLVRGHWDADDGGSILRHRRDKAVLRFVPGACGTPGHVYLEGLRASSLRPGWLSSVGVAFERPRAVRRKYDTHVPAWRSDADACMERLELQFTDPAYGEGLRASRSLGEHMVVLSPLKRVPFHGNHIRVTSAPTARIVRLETPEQWIRYGAPLVATSFCSDWVDHITTQIHDRDVYVLYPSEDAEAPVALAAFAMFEARQYAAHGRVMYVDTMVTHPDHKRKGWGNHVYNELIVEAVRSSLPTGSTYWILAQCVRKEIRFWKYKLDESAHAVSMLLQLHALGVCVVEDNKCSLRVRASVHY